jgi:hypothetical protein
MAAMNTMFRSTWKLSPEQIEGFDAEQRRLKAAAAGRRVAAATAEQADRALRAEPEHSSSAAPPGRHPG